MPETGIRYDQHHRIIDGNGKILVTNPSDPATGGYVTENQLKEWIEDVLAYPSVSQFPSTGEDGRLYIAKNTNTLYRWTGTQYVQLTADISGKEDKSNKVTSITPSSTDEQYPSAKAVYMETSRLEEPIKEISEDLGELEAEVGTLKDRTDTVESDIITLKDATDSLGAENIDQQRRISELEFDVMDLQSALSGFTEVEFKRETSGGTFDIPTPERGDLANSAEVMKVKGDSITSDNLWNEQWEVGSIDISTGLDTVDSTRIRSRNYTAVEAGATYHVVAPKTLIVLYYDSSKTYMSYEGWGAGANKLIPSGVAFIRFYIVSQTTYNHDIAIIKGTSGTYSPYFEGIRDSSNITVSAVSRNLFDKNSPRGSLFYSGSSIISNASYVSSVVEGLSGDVHLSMAGVSISDNIYFMESDSIDIGATIKRSGNISIINGGTITGITSRYLIISVWNTVADNIFDHLQIERGSTATEYTPYRTPSSITIPVSLKKGDEYDPSTGDVVENYASIDMGSLDWRYIESDNRIQALTSGLKEFSANIIMPIQFSSAIVAGGGVLRVYGTGYTDGDKFRRDVTGKTMVAELATPASRHLTDPILNNLPVWEGGQISVTSEGAQAEVEMKFMLNYSVDTRLQELEQKLQEQTLINARQNRQIENINDRLDGDLIENKFKITGETPDDAGVLSLPSSKLLPWSEVDEVHGKTVVWNQLIEPSSIIRQYLNLSSYDSTTTQLNMVVREAHSACRIEQNIDFASGHVYMILVNVKMSKQNDNFIINSSNSAFPQTYLYSVNPDVWTSMDKLVKSSVSGTGILRLYFGLTNEWVGGETISCIFHLVDLTTLFGVTETSQVTDWMKNWVRTYAEAHPQYDAGSLVDAQNVKVKSVGKNLVDYTNHTASGVVSVGTDGVVETQGTILPLFNFPTVVGKKYTVSMYTMSNFTAPSGLGMSAYRGKDVTYGSEDGRYGADYSVETVWGRKKITFTATSDWVSIQSIAKYVKDVQLEESEVETDYAPYSSHTLDIPQDWYTKASALGYDLGMEGTVIDMVNKEVTWKWGKVALASNASAWSRNNTLNGGYYYRREVVEASSTNYVGADNASYENQMSDRYSIMRRAYTSARNYDSAYSEKEGISIVGTTIAMYIADYRSLTLNDFLSKIDGSELAYKLATPVTKTFSELGFDPIDNGLPVESNGTITVISEGAQAEAKIHYAIDNRSTT